MIPIDHALLILKINENQWIQKLRKGEVSFSCVESFIKQEQQTGNSERGDKLEGVFARLLKGNPKISSIHRRLGEDLEIFEDDKDSNYVFLRRQSAKWKPIYCFYTYTVKDAINDVPVKNPGRHNIRICLDQRLYSSFLSSKNQSVGKKKKFTCAIIQSKSFVEYLKKSIELKKIKYEMNLIKYIDMDKGEFFIEPSDEYKELFYKSKKYEYQHEGRICLLNKELSIALPRYYLYTQRINKNLFLITHDQFILEFSLLFGEDGKTVLSL